jgi:hypothetical protein
MKYRFPALLPVLACCAFSGLLQAQEEGEAAPPAPAVEAEPLPQDTPETSVTEDVVPEEKAVLEEQKGDVLEMPAVPAEAATPRVLPRRGLRMEQVEREFGAPLARHPAVGQPPITRWDYDGFSVFFEHRTVLHAVQKDRPAEIQHKDELLPATAP